jgi:hypothetical protein
MWNIHTMEFYSEIRKNEMFAGKWIELEIFMIRMINDAH